MRIANEFFSGMIISSALFFCACDVKTEKEIVSVPEIRTVEVPVEVPGTSTIIKVPDIILVDKSVGIKSLPKSIETAPQDIQDLGKAVAKIFSVSGASGTGFFISKDGLFLTNEHVIPIAACASRRCPGYKIVTGFHKNGSVREYSDFEVLAQDSENYDFSIIKVKLNPGEHVDFLNIELSDVKTDASSNGSTHVVIGHPGGASLHFAEAKPIGLKDESVRFQAVVIPGNSGGPLIDLKTQRVIGLVKSMRTMPAKDGTGSAYFENQNQATALSVLNQYLQRKAGVDLLNINESTDMKTLSVSSQPLQAPDADDLKSLIRRPSDDVRVRHGLEQFIKFIGSPYEKTALSLMFEKSGKFTGSINLKTFNSLMQFSLAIGRDLDFETNLRLTTEQEVMTLSSSSDKTKAQILLNYFDDSKKTELQKECLKTVPNFAQILLLTPYNCATTRLSDGKSIFPLYAEWLIGKSGFATLDELMNVMSLLMISSPFAVDSTEDLVAIEQINNYVELKGKDIEVLMRNDNYAMGFLKKQVGIGAFKNTFEK